jgi:hypothetical protein
VQVSLLATDNTEITYYKIEIDGVLFDLTKDGDYYNYTFNIPGDSLTGITYKVIFNDTANNSNITSDTTITVTDNDDPINLIDTSDTSGTTGDVFTFEFDASDNIDLVEAEIFYWFGAGSPISEVITGSGPFTYTITIPLDSLDELHYYVQIKDTSGNSLTSSTIDISVTDNDAPTDILDTSDTTATTGDDFTFNVQASDNIGVVDIQIYYWFGDGEEMLIGAMGTESYSTTVSLPDDTTDTFHYYIVFIDAANNELIGPQVDVTITDNDPAVISNDQTDPTPEVGEELTFQIDASDNVGIFQVRVAYWFGEDETQKQFITLTGDNGTYSGAFTPDETGTLNYYFEVTDSAGNMHEGDQQSVQIASEPEEEEESNLLPWILVVIIILVVLIFFFLIMKKGKDEDEIPVVEEGLKTGEAEPEVEGEVPEEGEEPEVEALEEGEDIDVDPEVEPSGEGELNEVEEIEVSSEEEPEAGGEVEGPEEQIVESQEDSPGEEVADEIDSILDEVSEKDEH